MNNNESSKMLTADEYLEDGIITYNEAWRNLCELKRKRDKCSAILNDRHASSKETQDAYIEKLRLNDVINAREDMMNEFSSQALMFGYGLTQDRISMWHLKHSHKVALPKEACFRRFIYVDGE